VALRKNLSTRPLQRGFNNAALPFPAAADQPYDSSLAVFGSLFLNPEGLSSLSKYLPPSALFFYLVKKVSLLIMSKYREIISII